MLIAIYILSITMGEGFGLLSLYLKLRQRDSRETKKEINTPEAKKTGDIVNLVSDPM